MVYSPSVCQTAAKAVNVITQQSKPAKLANECQKRYLIKIQSVGP